MNNPGSIVYVHWYGKVLQGTVVNGHDIMGMVAVRIPVQGVQAIAIFRPAHVYTSIDEARQTEGVFRMPTKEEMKEFRDYKAIQIPVWEFISEVIERQKEVNAIIKSTISNPSEAWQAIQKFREEHWDQERNHLRIDAMNDFYRLWRIAVATRYGVTIEETLVAVDPGSPDGDKSGTIIVDTETGEILPTLPAEVEYRPIVSEERYQELKEKTKVKLTKKQKHSTGRIEYTDSIQTSFFD